MSVTKINTRIKKPDLSPMLYSKLPPQAPDLEGVVLGAVMLEPQKLDEVMEIITSEECFYSDANQRIYLSIRRMYERGARIDTMTVCAELRKNSELEMVGGSYYVTSLTRDVVSAAHIEEHARIIMQKYAARDLIRMAGDIISQAYEDTTDVFDLIDTVSDYSNQITDKMIKKQYTHIQGPVNKLIASTTEKVFAEEKMFGVPTGFKELDYVTGGWQPTDLILLAARPAVGKTAFALNILLGAVGLRIHDIRVNNFSQIVQDLLDSGKARSVAIFSLEMATEQLLQRMLANVCNLEYKRIKNGTISEVELRHFNAVCQQLGRLPIFFDDNASLNMTALRAKAKKLKKKHNVGLIIIDYLQLMEGEKYAGNREQELSKISRDLKKLAKDLEIPIIALSQLNRAVEGRANNTPQLSDLRESGALEQDADVVMFLYGNPEKVIKERPYKANERHLGFRKHRSGKCADLIYEFEGSYQRFNREELTVMDVDYKEVPGHEVRAVPSATFEQIKAAEDLKTKIDEPSDELPF